MLDLYEGLTAEAADGTIVPGAAQGWSVSEDGRQWTFTLRPGLKWSDGEPLTATQFAQGIAEAKSTESNAPFKELLEGIHSILVTSDTELTINVWRPLPYLPALLSLPVAAPERAVGSATPTQGTTTPGEGNASTTPTNGPYRVNSYRPNERIELERNPHFHSAADVAIERIIYLTLEDLNTELNLFRTGELDVTSEVPNARVDWIREHLGDQLRVAPYLSSYGYAVDVARLTQPDARVALAMALDRDVIVAKVTGAGERAATGWVPPGLAGYPNASFGWSSVDDDARLARAAQLWSAAWKDLGNPPKKLTLCTDASENHRRTAVALADQWKSALGVKVEIVEMEWKAYLARREQPDGCDLLRFGWSSVDDDARLARAAQLWSAAWKDVGKPPKKLTLCTDASENHRRTAVALADQWKSALGVKVDIVEMEWKAYLARREQPDGCDLLRFGWSADYADPEAFLTLFESRHPQNSFGFSDRRFDEAMYASRRATSAADRLRRLGEAEAILLEAMPVVPVFHRVTKRLVDPRVEGAEPNPLGHLPSRYLRLAPTPVRP
jgi:oligopeptide transport system substrate-binding protein